MLRNISYVSLSFIFVYVVGYLFHFFISRKLSPVGYGEFIVLNSLLLVVGNVSNILGIVALKSYMENVSESICVLRYFRILSVIVGTIMFAVFFVFSSIIKDFLNITYLPYLWMVSFNWIFLFLAVVEKSYLQATKRFDLFSFATATEVSLKLLFSVILLYTGFSVGGVLLGMLLSIMITSFFLLRVNKNFLGDIKKIPVKKLFRLGIYASPSGAFVYMDDLFLRRLFDPHTAGLLASATIIGKAFIGFFVAVLSVFLPEFISRSKEIKNLYIKYLLFVIAVFIISELGILIVGREIFYLLFGEQFIRGFDYLPYYLFSILPVVLIIGIFNVVIALEKIIWVVYIHIFIYFVGFVLLPIESVGQFFLYIFCINLTFLAIYLYMLKIKSRYY